MDKGATQASSMLASYDSALDNIKIHTEFLISDLSKPSSLDHQARQQLEIGSSIEHLPCIH